jgi:UDP-N-acetylglucosamine acyltransferase
MATVTETQVHPTALVDESAELGEGVMVGPFCIVGPGVSLGARTRLAGHVVIERDTAVGEDCQISYGAVLGTDPQDLKYAGERTYLRVGDRTVVREYATLNRGTRPPGSRRWGATAC